METPTAPGDGARVALDVAAELRAMRRFVSLAVHELRTPAAAIHGIAATLHGRAETLPTATNRLLVETLYEQSERFARTIDQLLDMSRLDNDAIDVKPVRIDVTTELRSIVAGVSCATEMIEISAPADLQAVLDPHALGHVVSNLVVNAVRYGTPPMTVSAEQRDTHFRLSVRDDGDGIPAEFVPHLFEPFRRGPTANAGDGSGLGLAIARSYAHALGGELLYESTGARGNQFTLVVPQDDTAFARG